MPFMSAATIHKICDSMRKNGPTEFNDPLIDEARANRQALVEEYGGDLRRLAEHLRRVQGQYDARTGPFLDLPRELQGELFPEMNKPLADPVIDEIRATRR